MTQATVRWDWILGGSAFVASSIVEFTLPAHVLGSGLIGGILFAAGLLLFAFGGGSVHNIFRGRHTATLATVVLAAGSLAAGLAVILPDEASAPLTVPDVSATAGFVRLGIIAVVVVHLGRTVTLPPRWRWAPLGAVTVQTVCWLLTQAVLANARGAEDWAVFVVTSWAALVTATVQIFIGILGIVLGARTRPPLGQEDLASTRNG
ncbi:hypothetical protein [Plantibacter sp. YIM 135249]|jgi:hypothetical protein|uniref:hypothetical protein n=1 Tax=Plantibacter sp. YIM 135249 TaxID=3423918 RepID=UPI003D33ABC7